MFVLYHHYRILYFIENFVKKYGQNYNITTIIFHTECLRSHILLFYGKSYDLLDVIGFSSLHSCVLVKNPLHFFYKFLNVKFIHRFEDIRVIRVGFRRPRKYVDFADGPDCIISLN